MKSFMKLTVIFTILLGGLCVCSCEKREFISGFYRPGFYEYQYTVKGKNLKIDVKKENTDPKKLLVVSVDENSDTISSNVFVKAYSLKKGKHTIDVKAGHKADNGLFIEESDIRSTNTFKCD